MRRLLLRRPAACTLSCYVVATHTATLIESVMICTPEDLWSLKACTRRFLTRQPRTDWLVAVSYIVDFTCTSTYNTMYRLHLTPKAFSYPLLRFAII